MRYALCGLLLAAGTCHDTPSSPPSSTAIVVEQPGDEVTFAAIGDFGFDGDPEAAVASLVHRWQPQLVITMGDNNYPSGAAATIDRNIGKHYHDFIAPYRGGFGSGADRNRFFPTLGNHDWRTWDLEPYLDYFELPGNERYYDFVWGPVHFFALDSDSSEPDGITADSKQAAWLKQRLEGSSAPWQVVYFHHAPYSSGDHGSTRDLQWPFAAWGADAVLTGHDHHYERLEVDGIVFAVNGLGGKSTYEMRKPLPQTIARYNEDYGALRGHADAQTLTLEFFNVDGKRIDTVSVTKPPSAQPQPEPTPSEPVAPKPTRSPNFEAYED